ncbi:MAG: S26 family signal peptidase, partial [Methylobacteriaceae bacterium]|nr:S26 family signal peptidase [Methylobacteriaceae bacterium]
RRGRPLPVWQGCVVLTADQVFLMNPDRPDSLDGRYFGPLGRNTIVGRAEPLWTDEEDR